MSAGIIAGVIALTGFVAMDGSMAHAAAKDTNLKTNACSGVNYALTGGKGDGCDNTYSVDSIWPMAYTVITWVLIAVGILCVVFIIIGGIKFATSSGEPDKTKSARNTILYAVIGLVIAVLANVIVSIVFNATSSIIAS